MSEKPRNSIKYYDFENSSEHSREVTKTTTHTDTHTHTHTDCTLPFLLHDYDTNGDINIPGSNYQKGGGERQSVRLA